MSLHPSELALEAYLLSRESGAAGGATAAHLASCARCAARVAEMESIGAEFRARVFPATVGAVENAAAAQPWWRRALVLAPVPAAAAALMLVVRTAGSAPDDVGRKGSAGLTLGLVAEAGGVARILTDGDPVPAGARVGFRMSVAAPCRLWLLSADETGAVSRIFPAEGDAAPLDRGGPLPGSAVLDATPGAERFFAICSHEALPFARVEAAVRDATSRGRGVRDPRPLEGLPEDAARSTVMVLRRP